MNILRISSSWHRGPALLYYFEDSGLEDYKGYFYFDSSENKIDGTTNDAEGKYFIGGVPEEYFVPEGETALGDQFYDWTEMKKLYIPASVTKIDFSTPPCSLVEIVVNEQNPKYDSRNNCNAVIETATNRLVLGCNTTIIPDGIKEIGDFAFLQAKLTEIIMPDTIEVIGDLSFECCRFLTHVTLPQNLKILKRSSFESCFNLSSIKMPKSVNCIKSSVFGRCEELTSIYYEGTVEQWHKIRKEKDWNKETPAISVHCSNGVVIIESTK